MLSRTLRNTALAVVLAVGAGLAAQPAAAGTHRTSDTPALTAAAESPVAGARATGLPLDPEFKRQVLEHLGSTEMEADHHKQIVRFLDQVESGNPTPNEPFKRQSYFELLEQSRKDIDRLKKNDGKFTDDLDTYLDAPDKYVYIPFEKTAKELNRAWTDYINIPNPADFGANLAAAHDTDWTAFALTVGGAFNLTTSMWGPAYSMYLSAQQHDWVNFSLAIVALHAIAIGVALPGVGAAIGLATALVSMIWGQFNKPPVPDAASTAREGRDKQWKEHLEKNLKDVVVPGLEESWQRAEQDAARVTALSEAVMDARFEELSPAEQQKAKAKVEENRKKMRDGLRENLDEFASEAKKELTENAVGELKQYALEKPEEDRRQPLGDRFPELKKAGIRWADAIVPMPGQGAGKVYWFSDTKVAHVTVSSKGGLEVVRGLRDIQEEFPALKNTAGGAFGKVYASFPRGDGKFYFFDGNRYAVIDPSSPGSLVESGWNADKFDLSGGFNGFYAVADGGTNQSQYRPRHIIFNSDRYQQLVMDTSKPRLENGTGPITNWYGLRDAGMTKDLTAFVPIPGTNDAYVVDTHGTVARVLWQRTASGPATPFARFTNGYLNKNKEALKPIVGGSGWYDDRFDGLKRDLLADDPKNSMPSDAELEALVPASDFKPITIPYAGYSDVPEPGKVYRLTNANSGLDVAVKDGDKGPGADIVQQRAGGPSEEWELVISDSGTGPYRKFVNKNSGLCLINYDSRHMEQGPCNLGAARVLLRMWPNDDGSYRILSYSGAEPKLAVKDNSTSAGALLELVPAATPSSSWLFTEVKR